MDGLDTALDRARRAYSDEREMMRVRQDVARKRNRLRKVSPASILNGRATEMLEELAWWGIPRPRETAEAERAQRAVLARLKQRDSGSPGYAQRRAAGFELLIWWVEQGNIVTATVETETAKDSYTVEFLSEQLALIDAHLDELAARKAANRIARAWLDQHPPHWTEDQPRSPVVISKPGGIS